MSSVNDDWERLVAAVLKREHFWKLCHRQSRSPSCCSDESISSSDTNLNPEHHGAASNFPSELMFHPAFDMFHDSCKRLLENAKQRNSRMKQINIENGAKGINREFLVELLMLSLLHHPDILLFIFPV